MVLKKEEWHVLKQMFDVIFLTSEKLCGKIDSIGLKFGGDSNNPDHMLIVFSDEVFGFQNWNMPDQRCYWDYIRSKKILKKDNVVVDSKGSKKFIEFALIGLTALNDQRVSFSKNILKDDIDFLKP